MVIIGIDPHKGSHTAVAIDEDECKLGEMRVRADRRQLEGLLKWAIDFPERAWAIESANGLGGLLSQQLVGAGEEVFDVPPTLSSRVRILATNRSQKNDPNDAYSVAIAALRSPRLRAVDTEDHIAVLRLLWNRHKNLAGAHTQAMCRLHALLAGIFPGGARRRLTASKASAMLAGFRPSTAVERVRKAQAQDLIGDIRRLDVQLKVSKRTIAEALVPVPTCLGALSGVGPIAAAIILAHTGDIRRFPSADDYASYNGTAPIDASSGPRKRHRLNPRGNRQLNHAMHIIAVSQMSHPGPGRDYYERKLAEGKSTKEAMRSLKRQISNAVYRQLRIDATR
jgi:transposase